ncbi:MULTISPECIES: hypothetical protein [Agrobacterium]|uniref:Uncharacterized protein n=1 Tax=Agrobacterium tumefaciens TaxID=358 RepID=A0AAF0H3D2_AGRTU|nr:MULTISPECIES: hypothetical protein [Agrobacterium]WGM61217.1 hypothetical protein CFBP5506_16250 [Agrobacterium tumefaciens]CVI63206.1 conserved hypothetical protein [Agrobacterium salinitolerans str. Hayward 0363]
MLPPVPKIAATDAAYGTTVSLTPREQVKQTTPPQPNTPAPENSSLFARAAIASLTSEFQLSRSTAILAEALGKLMNLPRQDGEAIETYVTRLTEALRTLPASQRLALEQQVGKALQGLTLSMLAEILKQPTGPDAARLALLVELSRYRGMDLAAKAVISSYQQNNSSNPAPTQSAQPKQQNAQSQNAEARPSPAATAQAANSATVSRLLPLLIGPLALSGTAMKATVSALTAQLDPRPAPSTPPADTLEMPTVAEKPDRRAENPARPLPPQIGSVTKEVSAEARPANPPRAETGDARPALPHREMMKPEQKESRSGFTPPSGPLADDAETMNTLLLAATAGKLPTKAAGTQQPLPAPQDVAQQPSNDQPAEKPALATAAARPSGEETETAAPRPEAQPPSRVMPDAEVRMAMLEQSVSQSLIAAALAKDGIPLPLVAYPPADEDYESETPPRGGGPFSEDEANDDTEADNSDDQDEKEERVAANDGIDTQESAAASASDDSAENYYLKMSGML